MCKYSSFRDNGKITTFFGSEICFIGGNMYLCSSKRLVFMIKQDIRWQQRFSNYRKALAKLIQAVDLLSVQIERDESVAELRIHSRTGLEGNGGLCRVSRIYRCSWLS